MSGNGEISYAMVLMMMMLAAMSTCQGAPSFRPKAEWRDDGEEQASAILTSNCDPVTGRCWEWLPLGDTRLGEYAVEQNAAEFNRGQPIHARDVDQVAANSWRETAPVYGRVSKKDVLSSKGWGPSGIPFSVLYMNSGAALGSSQAKAQLTRKKEDSSSPPPPPPPPLPIASAQHQQQPSNYNRVSLRNGIHGTQPRRHYSIIPQLFISYGWGPSGK